MILLMLSLVLIPGLFALMVWMLRGKNIRLMTLMALSLILNLIVLNGVTLFKYGYLVTAMRQFTKSYYLALGLSSFLAAFVSYSLIRRFNLRNQQVLLGRWSTLMMGFLAVGGYSYVHWLTRTSSTFNFEILMFNLKVPLNTTNSGFGKDIFTIVIIPLVFTIAFAYLLFSNDIIGRIDNADKNREALSTKLLRTLLPITLVVAMLIYSFNQLDLRNMIRYFTQKSSFIQDNYVEANDDILSFPQQKRNLIVIFVESLESTFFDLENGGARPYNLLPNLTRELTEGAVNFSHLESQYGGMKIMPGATWSIAGMTAQLSGVPYKVPVEVDGKAEETPFLPGIISVGDILKDQGYRNVLMVGSDAKDFGVRAFYNQHGGYEIFDYNTALDRGILPKDYFQWWGFEDKKLYEYSKDKLEELAAGDQPFNMVIETSDTHFPDGYTDGSCASSYDLPYANSIACADGLLNDFIQWAKGQDFYENTSIVIVGDHLSMDTEYFSDLQGYERTVFNLFLNADPKVLTGIKTQNRDFYAADVYPTILSSLGVDIKGNRLGLGTNLFSDVPTLFEVFGVEAVQDELSRRSEFYDETLLIGADRSRP